MLPTFHPASTIIPAAVAGLRAVSCELCERCLDRDRIRVATEDYYREPICAGCYDRIGEAQDERKAEEV